MDNTSNDPSGFVRSVSSRFLRRVSQWHRLRELSFRGRIVLYILLSSLIAFAGVASVSWYAIASFQQNKLQQGIQSNLRQIVLSLENSISNLNHVSQQLSYAGPIGKKFEQFLQATDTAEAYEVSRLLTELKQEIAFIGFTNPNIGFQAYVIPKTDTWFFNQFPVREDLALSDLPRLASYYKISYFGPHKSISRFSNQYVLSALREVDLPQGEGVYVYIETGFKLTQSILDVDRSELRAIHLMLDDDGRIAFSENSDRFPLQTLFEGFEEEGASYGITRSGRLTDYIWVQAFSNQGWSIVSLVHRKDFNRERNTWILQMALMTSLSLFLSLMAGRALWKMVYRPMMRFEEEIGWITRGDFHKNNARDHVREFDRLLVQFQEMKQQVLDLIETVSEKEKRRANLEIEKLRYQINPHFLMNTLNTAHWLAMMNEQPEIDKIVLSLNRLLAYNLGKSEDADTLRGEINALNEYVVLQQSRYQFHFNLRVETPEEILKMRIPRFILQPLVENAIFHGLSEDGTINVRVNGENPVRISIEDNGSGMTPEALLAMLENPEQEQQKMGMGIGMHYVKRILEATYGDQAQMMIHSVPGEGTRVMLTIPLHPGQSQPDTHNDCEGGSPCTGS